MTGPIGTLTQALDQLAARGYRTVTADGEYAKGNPTCRCCIVGLEGVERYVVAAGGVGDDTTAGWWADGIGHLSWAGNGTEIVDVLTQAGLDAVWCGNPARTITIRLTAEQAAALPPVCGECGRYDRSGEAPEGAAMCDCCDECGHADCSCCWFCGQPDEWCECGDEEDES